MLFHWPKWKPKAKNRNTIQGNDPKRARSKAVLMPFDKCHSIFKPTCINNKFLWVKYDSAAETKDFWFTVASIPAKNQLQTCAPSVFVYNFYELPHGSYNRVTPSTNLHMPISQIFSLAISVPALSQIVSVNHKQKVIAIPAACCTARPAYCYGFLLKKHTFYLEVAEGKSWQSITQLL